MDDLLQCKLRPFAPHMMEIELARTPLIRLTALLEREPEPLSSTVDHMDRQLQRTPPWRKSVLLALLLTVGIGIVIWSVFASRQGVYRARAEELTIATVAKNSFEDFVAVRATVAPFETHYITAADGGTVLRVLVEDGAVVDAGQRLVVLSNTALQSQIAARQADIAAQINTLDNTRIQLEEARFRFKRDLLDLEHQLTRLKAQLVRDKVLLDGNAIAPATYEEEKEEYAHDLHLREEIMAARDAQEKLREVQTLQIHEALRRLNENLRVAQASLDALTVVAPLAGQLTGLDAIVGQTKTPGTVLGQIDSHSKFKLIANVDEFYLSRIAMDQEAVFTVDDQEFKAKVASIHPQVTGGTFRVDLRFEEAAPSGVRNGQAIDLKIKLGGTTAALTVPNGPFYQETGGNWIFVVAPDGTSASRRVVHFGRRNPQFIEIENGLEPGDRVIVSSYQAFGKMNLLKLESRGAESK
jgi:HlyD family secretion protein